MYIVYILKSISTPRTYVGSTNDIARRLNDHNSGKSFFTKKFKPWVLIYKEECDSLQSARKREKYFKTAAGRKILRKIYEQYS